MVSMLARLIVVVCAVCQNAAAEPGTEPRMTKQKVIAAAKKAIEARYSGATKGYPFDAVFQNNGIWGVYAPRLSRGGGEPNAEVRDRDGKVLKIYFAR
jgi:hypothetical protein